jgi:transposase
VIDNPKTDPLCAVQPSAELHEMKAADDVMVMLGLHRRGWSARRIATELRVSRNTVKRYIAEGELVPYASGGRRKALDGHEDWLAERFDRHRGNAEVIREELAIERGIEVSLRTVERAVHALRQRQLAEAKATVRFETAPGHQLQVDFTTARVSIGGESVEAKLCVLTLGFSRRIYVRAFEHERQSAWLDAIEGAFMHFGGVPRELLVDNARALVTRHDGRGVEFNATFAAFCKHWDVTPRACQPYRARTKGKDERAVQYVKRNAVAGRRFASWSHFESHLADWIGRVADARTHGTIGERPIDRFEREEAAALRSIDRGGFSPVRCLSRKVASDACVQVDSHAYSVPFRLIGEEVEVRVMGEQVEVWRGRERVACHALSRVRHGRTVERAHLRGITRAAAVPVLTSELQRPLSAYAELVEAMA